MKIQNLILLVLSFVVFSCSGQKSNKVETISAVVFSEKIKSTSNPQILDVRTPEEFSSDHIDNAVNINWNDENFMTNVAKYDKSKPVFVYCLSGGRSKKAADKLEELGFTTIYNLEGGILKWNAQGFEKPTEKIIGMCSQEYAELLKTDKKVLINFYAEWCEPCKKMAPYILKMQNQLADKVVIVRLNADENKTLLKDLKIDELPVLILYENKELKWRHAGFLSEDDLKKQL
jgi:thioredoxin